MSLPCNLLVRKEVFMKLGGFQEDLHVGEDVDLCWRMQDSGYDLEYGPIGKIYHRHRNTVQAFCRRRFDYGTSEPRAATTVCRQDQATYFFRRACFLFWLCAILSAVTQSLLPLGAGGAVLIGDVLIKQGKIRKKWRQGGFSSCCLRLLAGATSPFSTTAVPLYRGITWCGASC